MTIHFSIGSIILSSSRLCFVMYNLQTKDINIIINGNTTTCCVFVCATHYNNSLNLFYNSMNLLPTSFRVKLFEL